MVKGYTWRDFAQYNTYGTGSRAGGYVKPDEARICIEECDHPDECVGAIKPYRKRCALERYKAAANGKSKTTDSNKIPSGYLTIREVARIKHRTIENIRHAILRGRFPGARKLNESKTARWIIPEDSI
jgi:hypothetical protein